MFDQARWAASEFANANIRLQDSMSETEIISKNEERNRIAREIHDTIGHTLTAVLVQIRFAQELLRVDPTRLPDRFKRLENMIRTAISEVRLEVSKLKEVRLSSESWRNRWLRLCKNFADCTGMSVNVDISDNLESVDDGVGQATYRIIQETLTNACRHGKAELVDVSMTIREETGEIILRISDDGLGADHIKLGNGLCGIRERVNKLNGEVAFRTKIYKGFDIGIIMPWNGDSSHAKNQGFSSR